MEQKPENQSTNFSSNHTFTLIGSGVFLLLCVKSYGSILKTGFIDLGLLAGIDGYLIYWFKLLMAGLCIIVFVIIIIRKIQREFGENPNYVTRFFYQLLCLYIISFAIHFLYRYCIIRWAPLEYHENFLTYQKILFQTDAYYHIGESFFDITVAVFCGVYLIRRDRLIQKKAEYV